MPHPKVSAGVLGGAVSIIFVWFVGQIAHIAIPPEVASAITVIFSFAVSYMVPGSNNENTPVAK